MTPEFIILLGRESLMTVIVLAAPMLGLGVAVGLMVAIFQAATQIHEQTLTLIPRWRRRDLASRCSLRG